MIELYYFPTPPNNRVLMMLEETGLSYELKLVNLLEKEQLTPEFAKISANHRVPAIIDTEANLSLFESGAILQYLAAKSGKLIPKEKNKYYEVIQWVHFHMAGVAPMFSRMIYGSKERTDAPKARGALAKMFCKHDYEMPQNIANIKSMETTIKECVRYSEVLDKHLGESPYMAGSEYSIADVVAYPVLVDHRIPKDLLDLSKYKNLTHWIENVRSRDATIRAYDKALELAKQVALPEWFMRIYQSS